jgi:O-antigen/teichoic acid export membrane protein
MIKAYFSYHRNSNIGIIAGLAGSNLLGMAIGIIGTLVQSRYVSPEDLGYFRSFTIATGYAFVLNLGIFGAIQRLYPYYIGKGDKPKAIAVVEIAQSWNVLVTILISLIFLSLSLFSLHNSNWKASLGWLAQIVAMVGFVYGGYLAATFRSGSEFKTLSKSAVISSTSSLLVLPLFIFIPYIALAIRSMFGPLINIIYMHRNRPLRVRWRFNLKELFDLFYKGFPIFISGYGASTFWAVVETSIILKLYGTYHLGLWSISFMISEAAIKIPQAISSVYSPKIMETFGRTNSVGATLQIMKKPIMIGVPLMFLIVLAAVLILPYVVPIVMPKYIDALPIMYLFMLLLPLNLMDIPFQILIAKGNGTAQNVSIFAGLLLFIILSFLFNYLEYGLIGIVTASLIGRLFSRLMSYYYVYLDYRLESKFL